MSLTGHFAMNTCGLPGDAIWDRKAMARGVADDVPDVQLQSRAAS